MLQKLRDNHEFLRSTQQGLIEHLLCLHLNLTNQTKLRMLRLQNIVDPYLYKVLPMFSLLVCQSFYVQKQIRIL